MYGSTDLLQDSRQILHYLLIAEAYHAHTIGLKDLAAGCVVVGLLGMNRSVEFDHQTCGVAIEVDDKAGDHVLAPEVKTINLVAAHGLPKDGLGGSLVTA